MCCCVQVRGLTHYRANDNSTLDVGSCQQHPARDVRGMSDDAPIAATTRACRRFAKVPKGEVRLLLGHRVRAHEQGWRDGDAVGLGGLLWLMTITILVGSPISANS